MPGITEVGPRYQLQTDGPPEFTVTKCSTCKLATSHEWVKIQPFPLTPVADAIEEMNKVRRLIMCTQCGSLSLKK